jgi:hypothetical protein
MRNGYRVYDSDTHIGPSADTLERYLASRVRELVPDLESYKVPYKRHATGIEYNPPYPKRFRLSRGSAVGGWGADVPRVLGEAQPRVIAGGASGQFMGSKYPNLHSDDWDADGRIRDMDDEGVDVHVADASILAGQAGMKIETLTSSSCARNIAIWTTFAANTRTGSSR